MKQLVKIFAFFMLLFQWLDVRAELSIERFSADILSDGTRIYADVYKPKPADTSTKFPAVIMSHGWGGTANLLTDTARDIAKSGFVVVVIDYRGWGKSDARIVQFKTKDGKFKSRELREVVDPINQAEDILNTINWVSSEPSVDATKIGLWGTSFSGGLVVYVAARDARVKAFVSQVGAMGWGLYGDRFVHSWNEKGNQRSRGEIDFPMPGVKEQGNLRGGMVWEKLSRFKPLDDASSISNVASLFIVAKKEELFNNAEHSWLAYNKIAGNKEYLEIPNITHYEIYTGQGRQIASKAAIEWFEKFLKN
jgi:dienelactone hydrolase